MNDNEIQTTYEKDESEIAPLFTYITSEFKIPHEIIGHTMKMLQDHHVFTLDALRLLTYNDLREIGLSVGLSRIIFTQIASFSQLANDSQLSQDTSTNDQTRSGSFYSKKRKKKEPTKAQLSVEELQRIVNDFGESISPAHSAFTFVVESNQKVLCCICNKVISLNKPGELWALERHVKPDQNHAQLSFHMRRFLSKQQENIEQRRDVNQNEEPISVPDSTISEAKKNDDTTSFMTFNHSLPDDASNSQL